jgi:hypothetical protein
MKKLIITFICGISGFLSIAAAYTPTTGDLNTVSQLNAQLDKITQ